MKKLPIEQKINNQNFIEVVCFRITLIICNLVWLVTFE